MRVGSAEWRRAALGLGMSGFATFALLYCVQPLMPAFSVRFRVGPAAASLTLAVATAVLTVTLFLGSVASERWGRKRVMTASLFGSAILNLLCAAAPHWDALLGLRLAEGVVAGGVPSVAMAYLADEMDPAGLGLAMGIYIAGNAVGGMLGRLLTGLIADLAGWRAAMAGLGGLALVAAVLFVRLLPPERRFNARAGQGAAFHLATFRALLRDGAFLPLFGIGLLIAGPFVSVYDYAAYRLVAPPYRLGQTGIGLIFLVYLFGIASSAGFGRAADRFGRSRPIAIGFAVMVAGLAVSLARPLGAIVAGIALLTIGFFGVHSVASAWVGGLGGTRRSHASALYLFCFYAGMSVFGAAGGLAWQAGRWPGVCAMGTALCLAGLWLVRRLPPQAR